MSNTAYNLDDKEYSEYFEFTIFSNKYKFRYPSGQELNELRDDIKDGNDGLGIMQRFISSVDDSPDFEETWNRMKVPQIKAFRNMLMTELGE